MRKQLKLNLSAELIVDLFAGGGGASLGIELATGYMVDIAINHDVEAIAMHMANHPTTRHLRADIREVDPAQATEGRPVGLLWASPDCKHHSKAKGGKPRDTGIRSLAWVVVRWAKTVRPRIICLENVEEFKDWCPLDAEGYPVKAKKGQTFRIWKQRLEKLGYRVEHRELRACDYGAPTIRKRLFVVARRDGLPIVWPEATHGPGRAQPWRTAADCIDWTLPCHSIFLGPEEARAAGVKRPLAEATLRRIAKGIKRYVLDAPQPFIVNTANGKTTGRAPNHWPLEEPLRTITSAPGFGLVAPFITTYYGDKRPADVRGCAMGEMLGTQTTENRHGIVAATLCHLGHGEASANHPRRFSHGIRDISDPLNTVCASGVAAGLVTAFLAKHFGGRCTNPAASLQAPAPTVTAVDHTSLIASNLIKLRGYNVGQPNSQPLATVSAQGLHHAEVRAFLVKYYGAADGAALSDPLHTVTTLDRFGLVRVQGEDYAIADIGLRMLSPRELFRAQGFPDAYIIDQRADGRPLTKTAQTRMCGNSVCPPIAAALVRANYREIELEKCA